MKARKRPFLAGVYDAAGPDDRPEHTPWGAPRGCVVYASTARAAAAAVLVQLHSDEGLALSLTQRVTTADTENYCRLVGPLGRRWVYIATASVTEKTAREYQRLMKGLSN